MSDFKNEVRAAMQFIKTNLEIAINSMVAADVDTEEVEKALQVAEATLAVIAKEEDNAGKA